MNHDFCFYTHCSDYYLIIFNEDGIKRVVTDAEISVDNGHQVHAYDQANKKYYPCNVLFKSGKFYRYYVRDVHEML